MLTPLQTLNSFASRLSSINSSVVNQDESRVSSLAPLLSSSLASPTSTVTFPCLWLGPPNQRRENCTSSNNSFADLRVSHWMSQSVRFDDEEKVPQVPQVLLNSITSSFRAVVHEKRRFFVRNSKLFLAVNTKKTSGRDATLRLATLEMLSKSPIFRVSAVITRFRTMPLSKGRVKEQHTGVSIGEAELPLTCTIKLQVVVCNEQKVNITMHAPGKIRGEFRLNNRNLMEHIELELDTAVLYNYMKERAGNLVKIADRIVTKQVTTHTTNQNTKQTRILAHSSSSSEQTPAAAASSTPILRDGSDLGQLENNKERVARCA